MNFLTDKLASTFFIEEDRKTFIEVIWSIDASCWKEAIKSELESIMSNQTWELVDLPNGSRPISGKWIFKKKLRPDGSIDKYKPRLMIRGFNQKKGIDYFVTYSPATIIATIRTLVTLVAIHSLVVHQMDVKTSFFNGDLKEEIYMCQHEGSLVHG